MYDLFAAPIANGLRNTHAWSTQTPLTGVASGPVGGAAMLVFHGVKQVAEQRELLRVAREGAKKALKSYWWPQGNKWVDSWTDLPNRCIETGFE